MSRLQDIENALKAINETVFQELCDSYLLLKNRNYSLFSRTGSQCGKQKTIKGTPDSFMILPNGKYLFIEYSTNISASVKKLKKDLIKCLDVNKTSIPHSEIEEIILCINFNLNTIESKGLYDKIPLRSITLTIISLDSLAIELHLNHRDLTNQYLGLALDTGQIVSIDKFVEEYNRAANGISTPLNNEFLHREKELQELKESISNSDFVILTGAPGIGKTKLALETVKSFLKDNETYTAYCISYKNHNLLEDLHQYFNVDMDYLLFVDDANRIDAFSQITGFYKGYRKGKLKVIITVRDYAFQEIGSLCQEFAPRRVDLMKFSDEQIIDIIKADSFKILNPAYQKEIVRIADGNPRLAIMTALLAKSKQNIYALSDVSDLFEKYFSTFIKDDGEFAKEINIKCLGLIAFFYTIPYKNKELVIPILERFEIIYSDFIDIIDKLDKLELVEVQFEHVKIPEQNLSTFFFYKSFIKDKLLSFEILLKNYFDNNCTRFRDCVIPANNTFGHQNVMDKLKPDLQKHLHSIKNEKEKAYKFLSTFWFYLQPETLEFVYNKVESLPVDEVSKFNVSYKPNAFAYNKNEIIELLGNFFKYPDKHLKDVLELAFEFIKKSPAQLPELICKIREQLFFDRDDEDTLFLRQTTLFDIIISGLNKSENLLSAVFYDLSKDFLNFKFHHTKSGRSNSIYWYDYQLPSIYPIHEFRNKIWKALDSNFSKHPTESLELLVNYSNSSRTGINEIIDYDISFVIEIIEKLLNKDSFEHCLYVQDQIRWFKKNSISNTIFSTLTQKFTNPTYEIFLKIDQDRYRDKEIFDFDDSTEYHKLKEAEIRNSFLFNSQQEINEFYDVFVYLKKLAKNTWSYNPTLDCVINNNCTINFNLGCQLFKLIIENDNEIGYVPGVVFGCQLRTKGNAQKIWDIIQSKSFKLKSQWELSFFGNLDETLIRKKHITAILKTIKQIQESVIMIFNSLQKYLFFEPKLFQKILRIIVKKNEEDQIHLQIWMDFFDKHFDILGENVNFIEKAYLQQIKLQSHIEHENKVFLRILKKDAKFIIRYIKRFYSESKYGLSNNNEILSFVWVIDDIEIQVAKIFDFAVEKEIYTGVGDHFCNSFFRNLPEESKTKAAKFLLEYAKNHHYNSDKMNIVVDIARHTMREFFEKILLQHISLNQDLNVFSEIWWRGNGGSYSGNVIIGDIEASEWRNILSIIEKSDVGIKLIPIKQYVNTNIESCIRSGEWERQRRFLERY